MKEYDELTFWDELVNHLTKKVILEKYTQEELMQMDRDSRFKVICEVEDIVREHLHHHGINQIVIK
jgi:hypothetical protein